MTANTIGRMGWREKFALARKARGVTQDELCELTGIGQNTISALEAGPSFPKLKTLMDAAEVLKIDLGWLFSDTADKIPDDIERAARLAFEAKLAAVGPERMLAMLVVSNEYGRDLGRVESSQAITHDKNPDVPDHPPFTFRPLPNPPASSRPPQIQLEDLSPEADPLRGSQGKRKPC